MAIFDVGNRIVSAGERPWGFSGSKNGWLTVNPLPERSQESFFPFQQNLIDSMGAHTCVSTGTPVFTAFNSLAAMQLNEDGTNILSDVESPTYSGDDLFTISLWAFHETGVDQCFFSGSASSAGEFMPGLHISDDKIYTDNWHFGAGGGPFLYGSTMSEGWHHVCLVKTGPNLFVVYVDGAVAIAEFSAPISTGTSFLVFGCFCHPSFGYDQFSRIRNVRIFRDALNLADISFLCLKKL